MSSKKVEAASSSETFVYIYKSTLHQSPERLNFNSVTGFIFRYDLYIISA